MLDFVKILSRPRGKKDLEVYPEFLIKKSRDLMIKGRDFYAVWDEETGLWSMDENTVVDMIDAEIHKEVERAKERFEGNVVGLYMGVSGTRSIQRWHTYIQKDMRDNYVELDKKLIFADTVTTREDYASKKLGYVLAKGNHDCWDELTDVLYFPAEKTKIEWIIGAVVVGDSKTIQKFGVMYGDRGTGKSTIINIVEELFQGYCSAFESKPLGSSNAAFALEPFKHNPLLAIEHDGNLSRIEDNSRLNSIVSHETMVINEKHKSLYTLKFNSFLLMATNRPVRITDSKSGILRRLIDISPTGRKIPQDRYLYLMNNIKFELGAIAYHCMEVYKSKGKHYYDNYIPQMMLGETNDFYNFMEDQYDVFKKQDGTTLKSAWSAYKQYCDDAKVPYPYSLKVFKAELKSYFDEHKDRAGLPDGTWVRNYYHGFRYDKFDYISKQEEESLSENLVTGIELSPVDEYGCVFDKVFTACPAQYANKNDKPLKPWDDVTTTLCDIDTSKVHYILPPDNLICVDFDLKDEAGKKSLALNLEAAQEWPLTYAEVSKSGSALHLYYIYTGDVTKLSRIFAEDIEIKVFTGKSSLRRKVTKVFNHEIATISSGLPLKEVNKTVSDKTIENERHLKNLILKALRKEVEPGYTVTCINFIDQVLKEAYEDGIKYDLTSMRPDVLAFALGSSNNAEYCADKVKDMKFASEEPSDPVNAKKGTIVFFDVEVFPNLFVIVWKAKDKQPVTLINPSPADVEALLDFNLIGFNNRRYDNHILYGALMGYNNAELYRLSQRIINKSPNAFFREAYNISYADIYEFSSKKQSLKKWEIQLKIHHQELGLKWDLPVPESMWDKVAEYCTYDVLATEATYEACKQDFVAREMLADLSGLKINDTTRMHTTKIIFGGNKKPELVYTDLSTIFPGYTFDGYRSSYHGEDPGEGGYVYSEPGSYTDVALLDIASMHPTSIINLNLFGEYTANFENILKARLAIKHGEFEKVRGMFDGKLSKYLETEEQADALAYALKIIINSVYGYTTATFDNPFKDPRNKDNIVAKRGALFMINLKEEVQKRGYTVAHIKTDSIKIPNADPEIIQFVMDYGKEYGYTFEHEATYNRMCLVNDAVYIAKYATAEECKTLYDYIPSDCRKHGGEWSATGTQFQVPYVFKTLFSKEKLEFDDYCETKSVTTALYLDCREGLPSVENLEKIKAARGMAPEKRTRRQQELVDSWSNMTDEELDNDIAKGHNYIFVGRVGRFVPMRPGCGAGYLLREKDGKFHAATGSKGYLWLEAETVKNAQLEKFIDESYFKRLANEAIEAISEYEDFEWFVSSSSEYAETA